MQIRGLVFDFDGLILDTESPLFQAWQEIYKDYGAELSLEKYALCVGASFASFDPSRHLAEITSTRLDHQDLHDRANEYGNRLLLTQPLRPGFPRLFDEARALGIRMAVASSSTRAWVLGNLQERKIDHYFDAVKTAEDVSRIKPAPDLYTSAIRALGLEPVEALAFEDSPNGVTAALSAGLRCVAVPNSVTRFLPMDQGACILEDLGEYSLAQVLAFFKD